MALIHSTFVWSYEIGARLSAFAFCAIWKVNDNDLHNYPLMLIAKSMLIVVLMVTAPIMIPRNETIRKLADKLREEYAEK